MNEFITYTIVRLKIYVCAKLEILDVRFLSLFSIVPI